MKNQINSGEVVIYTNTGSAIAAGDVVVMGKMVGIAVNDIAATTGVGAVSIDGAYRLTKKTASDVIAQGDPIVYDSGIKVASAGTTLSAVVVGRAILGSANGATTVDVALGL